jgi:MerR family redox-sensitive transcriptional activator SoxR
MSSEEFTKISIGEMARRSGLAPSAIRYYESRGLLRSYRTEGGQRKYDGQAELTLRQLRFAQSVGFSLAEMGDLLGPLESSEPLFAHWRVLAERKLAELDVVIEQAHEMKTRLRQALDCRCEAPEDCGLLG